MMNKYLPIFAGSVMALLVGCSTVETREVVKPTVPLSHPWRETDSFSRSRSVSGTSHLPVKNITPRGKGSMSPKFTFALKKAAYEGSAEAKKILEKIQKNVNVDDIICQALEAVVLHNMRSPLNENYVKTGIGIAAKKSQRVEYNFAPPSGKLIFAARQKKNRNSDVILLYQERYELRQYVFMWLKECGLERKDIYWVPLFTYLELELLGIEADYKKIVSAGKN